MYFSSGLRTEEVVVSLAVTVMGVLDGGSSLLGYIRSPDIVRARVDDLIHVKNSIDHA